VYKFSKTVGANSKIIGKIHAEDPQPLGAATQILVAPDLCSPHHYALKSVKVKMFILS
jgi:hypothetical protein